MTEQYKPFDRRRIIYTALTESERTLECYTKMLADHFAAHNHQHFRDWMAYANDRYARALHLEARLTVEPVKLLPPQFDLFH